MIKEENNMSETVYERILMRHEAEEELEENTITIAGTSIAIKDGIMDRLPFLKDEIPEEKLTSLEEVIFDAANGTADGALAKMKYTAIHNGACLIQMGETLEKYIRDNREELATEDLLFFIRKLLLESHKIEEVKLALFLYEGLFENRPELEEIILNYAKSAEFALYSMALVKRMDNGNQKLFEVVKGTTGSALVEAVNLLDPETEEMEDWIFREGTDPFLSYYYSSVPITKKCNLIRRMQDPALSEDDYYTLCRVIYGYFEEGYANGYETLDHVMDILQEFFKLCRNRITDFMLMILCDMHETIADFSARRNAPQIVLEEEYCLEMIEGIMNSQAVRNTIIEHVNQGEWIPLGVLTGAVNDEMILETIRSDPMKNAGSFRYLRDEDVRRKALNLYLEEALRNRILSDTETYFGVFCAVLEMCRELNVPDEQYFREALNLENFFLSARAAYTLKAIDEKGIPVDDDLLFRAKNFLYRMDQEKMIS